MTHTESKDSNEAKLNQFVVQLVPWTTLFGRSVQCGSSREFDDTKLEPRNTVMHYSRILSSAHLSRRAAPSDAMHASGVAKQSFIEPCRIL